jgi:hypothetical protein
MNRAKQVIVGYLASQLFAEKLMTAQGIRMLLGIKVRMSGSFNGRKGPQNQRSECRYETSYPIIMTEIKLLECQLVRIITHESKDRLLFLLKKL